MSDPLASVTPGDPLRISADTFNLLLDAGKFVRDRRLGRTGAGQALDEPVTPALQVYVRNDTGASLAAFSVVALGTPVISATDAQHTVRRQPVFPGTAPAASTDAFAVTIEPLGTGKVGRAVVMGVVPVDLNVTDSSHTAATPAAAVTATLASATNGPARIIWKASGTGTKRAVVLIGRDQNGGTSGYDRVQEEGSNLTQRATLNFVGAAITAADDGANTRTNVTAHVASTTQTGAVDTSTQTFAGQKLFQHSASAGLAGCWANGSLSDADTPTTEATAPSPTATTLQVISDYPALTVYTADGGGCLSYIYTSVGPNDGSHGQDVWVQPKAHHSGGIYYTGRLIVVGRYGAWNADDGKVYTGLTGVITIHDENGTDQELTLCGGLVVGWSGSGPAALP